MNNSPLSYILGAILLAVVAGGTIYIAQIREENARLKVQAAAKPLSRPADLAPAAPAAPAAPRAPAPDRVISDTDRKTMVAKLSGDGTTSGAGNPVWFATAAGNSESAAFLNQLKGIFEEAGWQVKGNSQLTFPLKAGVFIFVAEDNAPSYIAQVNDALGVLGISPTIGTGYREFYKTKKAETPTFNGFDLAPDQDYVLVVGSKG